MSAMNLIDRDKDLPIIEKARQAGTRFFLWIHWPPDLGLEVWNSLLCKTNPADVYFGEREPEGMYDFESVTGKKYVTIPNAANKKLHFPTVPMKKYEYDLVFLGTNLPLKQKLFSTILEPLRKKYRVGLFGPGWTTKDSVLRAIQKFARNAGMIKFANWINDRRITVPLDEENALYSSAKICLNFHEREPDGSQPHYILNQRTFKIPACGGFELCDKVPALRNYFTEDEMVMVDIEPSKWLETIEYYLTHEEERKAIQKKATGRALRDHMYHNRVEQVIALYNEQVSVSRG
jgi:spore maturation protein CgeB